MKYVDEATNTNRLIIATKEVIVSAGVVDSPKLLMLSGIGPSSNLQQAGIHVIKNLPVGTNLHDHVAIAPFVINVKNHTQASSLVNV